MLKKLIIPSLENAAPGRAEPLITATTHYVNHQPLKGPFDNALQQVQFGMGCFWGAERALWKTDGVFVTAVGYAGGHTKNPTYEEVCAGITGHTEVVLVLFNPLKISFENLLKIFWEQHNPTQGMRQGNDIGTQYRSAIYVNNPDEEKIAEESRAHYQIRLWQQGFSGITTEIKTRQAFYYAEDYHQQYLAKNPGGYCNLQSIDKTTLPKF